MTQRSRSAHDGRRFVPEVTALLGDFDTVLAPGVGLWRDAPAAGSVIAGGDPIGALEILGVLHRLLAPRGVRGVVVYDVPLRLARAPIAYKTPLFRLDRSSLGALDSAELADTGAGSDTPGGALRFTSPLSGRFYARPGPDQPPFVKPGDTVTRGQTVALLEVMKTFNRITYGGDTLPETAKVVRVIPQSEDDLEAGDPILELEPARGGVSQLS